MLHDHGIDEPECITTVKLEELTVGSNAVLSECCVNEPLDITSTTNFPCPPRPKRDNDACSVVYLGNALLNRTVREPDL